MGTSSNLSVRLKRPEPGQKDPMVKDFTFTIQDPKTGVLWCYLCVMEKSRGRKHLVRLGIVDEQRIKEADQVFVCADCGAMVDDVLGLLPMTDEEKKVAPSIQGHCPKCKEGFCLTIRKDEIGKGPNIFESEEVSNERH